MDEVYVRSCDDVAGRVSLGSCCVPESGGAMQKNFAVDPNTP
jgi:hypothetical protein